VWQVCSLSVFWVNNTAHLLHTFNVQWIIYSLPYEMTDHQRY